MPIAAAWKYAVWTERRKWADAGGALRNLHSSVRLYYFSMNFEEALYIMKSASAYHLIFSEYPDVVSIDDMQKMLGNISKKAAYKLIRDKKIEAFKIGKEFRIPQLNILSFLNMTT